MKHFLRLIALLVSLSISTAALAQFSYINPMPGSRMKNKETSIILRNGAFIDPASLNSHPVSVTGNKSGSHPVRLVLADDGKTICVYPVTPFADDESVTVDVADGFSKTDGSLITGTSFSFSTHPAHPIVPQVYDNGETRENCQLVPYDITSTPAAYDADVFYYNFWSSAPLCWARTIITNGGDSVYADFDNSNGVAFDINRNGYITYNDADAHAWKMEDSSFNLVKTYFAGNGYFADEHEFLIFPNGYYFMMALDTAFNQDLTSLYLIQGNDTIYGHNGVNVIGNVVQEFDPSGNVIFEWNSFDHFNYQDAMFWVLSTAVSLGSGSYWDWYHSNSIELESDSSSFLLSSRHYGEISKIDLNTGNFIWRLGGVNNEFKFIGDDSDLYVTPATGDTFYFSGQHDIRRLANGNITLFNNDNALSPVCSDAKEYKLDEANKTATLVWRYAHPKVNNFNLASNAMGSVQVLANGDRFINWGLIGLAQHYDIMPKMTEVDSLGNIVWELNWPYDGMHTYASYRAFKYKWEPCNVLSDASLSVDSTSSTAAWLSWGTNSKITSYILEYKLCSSSNWIAIPLDTNAYLLTGLLNDSCYNWRVNSICTIYDDTTTGITHQFNTDNALSVYMPLATLSALRVFPNPASEQTVIEFTANFSGSLQLSVSNVLGTLVMSNTVTVQAGTNKMNVDLNNFTPGAYLLQLQSGETVVRHQLIVN